MSGAPRVAIAGFVHETNSFSLLATRYEDFDSCIFTGGILRGAALDAFLARALLACGGFYRRALDEGLQPLPLLYAFAEPSGLVREDAFEAIVGEMIAGLEALTEVDAVFLELHGAMICEAYDEAEAQIVERVRRVVGEAVPIVAAFDLHGNLTPRTLGQLDAAVAFRTYPHIDMVATGERACAVLQRRLAGERFVLAWRALPFLIPINRQSHLEEPCKSLYPLLAASEARSPALASLNLLTGFPLGDVPEAGPSVFAYAASQVLAERAVDELLAAVLRREPQFVSHLASADQAAREAAAWSADKPLLLADVQDNAGGGASSDTVEVIAALLRHRVQGAIVGLLHDPEFVEQAHRHGVGCSVELALGGKSMPGQSPLRERFEILALSSAPFQLVGAVAGGVRMDLGRSALVRCQGVRIVVTSGRTQCMDSGYFRHFGLQPERQRVIVVKSANHYRADFQPLIGSIIEVESPGACMMDPGRIPYRRLRVQVRRVAASVPPLE
ncbi:M81 family metallopeptidase [Stutzerimonas kirkiae]|uniref:M81 family metallopeptidase n=1 Tax=Stutzerimonas kirkiae TaxID=2211392 RepID=UPI0010384B9D|nr:M81 family metallopeptidase [Stutzerimonas kirkiae]TBV16056.1 microcystin degradation protein MlrC [Stutzerimonas kirkiae]